MTSAALRDAITLRATELGFVGVGVTGTAPFLEARERGLDAVAAGRMDGMPWYGAQRVMRSSNPAWRFPWAKSILALAWPYAPTDAPPAPVDGAPRGRFAAYACLDDGGRPGDYHRVLRRAMDELLRWTRVNHDPTLRYKRFIDHGWAIDRAIAERAGLGFCGKHASLMTPQAGSYVLLAAAVISTELPEGTPSQRSCGSCTACIPACPTGAIVAPGMIDARRCISYLTIEHEGRIDEELRPLMGTWAFGCDLCQEACPINHRLAPAPLPPGPGTTLHGPVSHPDLIELLTLADDDFAQRFAGTPVARSGRARLARNAAIALGNSGDTGACSALRTAAQDDPDDAVRDAAAWALRRLETA